MVSSPEHREDPPQCDVNAGKDEISRVFINENLLLFCDLPQAEPNTESPANVDAAKMWREDRQAFKKKACQSVRKSLDMV